MGGAVKSPSKNKRGLKLKKARVIKFQTESPDIFKYEKESSRGSFSKTLNPPPKKNKDKGSSQFKTLPANTIEPTEKGGCQMI